MSAPRKKLSGAENRKRAKEKFEDVNKSASKMRKWLYEAAPSSSSTDTSDTVSGISNNSCNLYTQVDSTNQLKLQGSDDGKQYHSSVLSQQGDNVQLASSDLLQLSSKDEIIDLMDPGTWPSQEKITDQQRSFLSKQAVLLNNEHPNNVDFRSTERNGRHLTHNMWFGTMANKEIIKRSWLVYSKTKNALYCTVCKLFASTSTSALCTEGLINWKKTLERLTEHEVSQTHKEYDVAFEPIKMNNPNAPIPKEQVRVTGVPAVTYDDKLLPSRLPVTDVWRSRLRDTAAGDRH
ncbi:hypothetical protein ACJJTC_008646 [Scirpophaga incertulas]